MEGKDAKILKKSDGNEMFFIQYILTLVITVTALISVLSYTFLSFYRISQEDTVTMGENAVSEQSEKLNNFLLRGMDVLQVTAMSVEYMLDDGANSEEIEKYLTEQSDEYKREIDKGFTSIYGYFRGDYLDGSDWVPDEDYVATERPWYIAAKQADGELITVPPYLDAQTNTIMFSIAQLLNDKESVISFDIEMNSIQEFAQDIHLNDNGIGFVLDGTGLVVAHYNESEKGKNYLTDMDMMDTDMQKLTQNVYDTTENSFEMEIGGEMCNVFCKQVQNEWYVVMIVSNSDLFRKLRYSIYLDIGISLIIFSVIFYFVTKSYSNRKKAIEYAEKIQDYKCTLEERVNEQTEHIKKQSDKICRMQENVIDGMATLIESRDGNTGEHVINTKHYVRLIATYMYNHNMYNDEIDSEYVENVISAAPLHDVGKIMISDVILNKPGKFTPEEFEIMKTHSIIGGNIVHKILGDDTDKKLLKITEDVAKYHHEKWNGKGYPEGLKEKEIPLCARIMAVADVFDALVSKRVYKNSISVQEAYEILVKDSGSHFDPEIVNVFMELRSEVEKFLKLK